MFASPAYADWKWVSENMNGTTFYVDFDRMRKIMGTLIFGLWGIIWNQ